MQQDGDRSDHLKNTWVNDIRDIICYYMIDDCFGCISYSVRFVDKLQSSIAC